MINELKRLLAAFVNKTNETDLLNAISISISYVFNRESLYKKNDRYYEVLDFLRPRETKRLFWAFVEKKNKEGLKTAIQVSFKYIFNRQKLIGDQQYSYGDSDLFTNPLISILVISFNSGDDLKELFISLNRQTYRKLEIILVENGSESSEHYLQELNFPHKYISSSNIGFAAANNLAFDYSIGDYVCLVNPDTVLEKNVIEILLNDLLIDKDAVVSVPKILFYKKFITVEINSNKAFELDLKKLSNSLNYKKFFIKHGEKIINKLNKKVKSKLDQIVLYIPIDESKAILNLKKSSKNQFFYYKINNSILNNKKICLEEEDGKNHRLIINCDKKIIWWSKTVINNAGSSLKKDGPFDRGFGEYDLGQFENKEYVLALCGCIAMISPRIFTQRKIFIDEFFAYYEDSELSNWIINKKYKILYNPKAIVYHKHSVSTEEGSLIWNTFVSRSKSLYDTLTSDNNEKIKGEIFHNKYLKVPSNLAKPLKNYDQNLKHKNRNLLFKKRKPSAAIYNSFWNTMGGGEKHALSLAKILSKDYEIYLLSESDFDENKLKSYFSIKFKFRKFISSKIDSKTTSCFDLFVNSTYNSRIVSFCPKSLYLVSFPHRYASKKFLKSYLFLHNSIYTKNWAIKYWGLHRNTILYPITELKTIRKRNKLNDHELYNQKRNIISIGRFSNNGHEKKQDFILKAFKKALSLTKSDFNLFLIGSLDYSRREDLNYYNKLEKMKNEKIHLFPNLEFSKLNNLLSISKFYIHATGVDKNPKDNPELFEHFGISIIEALLSDNYPIVFNIGGPAYTVKLTNIGETFTDFDSLVEILIRIFKNPTIEKYNFNNNPLEPFLEENNFSLKIIENYLSESNN